MQYEFFGASFKMLMNLFWCLDIECMYKFLHISTSTLFSYISCAIPAFHKSGIEP